MPLTTGRYQILCVHWSNVIVPRDGSDRSDLVGYVEGLEERQNADQVRTNYPFRNSSLRILVGYHPLTRREI